MTTHAAPQTPAAPETPAAPVEKPPWGDPENFDPEKAWKLIEGLKADKKELAKRPVLDDAAKAKLDEYDRISEAAKSDLDKANESLARYQTESEKWKSTAVATTVRALAATDFADPDDAVRNVDPAKYLDAGGVIDEKAIAADLAALLEAKPHYRRDQGSPTPRPPAPNAAQGASANGAGAADPRAQFGAVLQQAMQR